MANKRPPWKIPAVINPPERRCIQISVPDDPEHITILWGVLRGLSDWQRWERENTHSATLVAQVWREVVYAIDWSNMSCCPEPTNQRYNADGQLEVSYDNGATWTVDNSLDDRYSGTISPPLSGENGSEKRCVGATAAMEYVKQNLIDELQVGATYAEINGVGVALAALLGVTGVGILIAAFAAAVFLAGIAATQAAFTSEVWTDFKCILYCNSESDASFTTIDWENVKSDILSSFTGIVSAVLYNWVNSVGRVGLTNAARSGFAQTGDCSGCDCDCGGETIGLTLDLFFGSDAQQTGCNVKGTAEPDTDGYSVSWDWDGTNPWKLMVEGLLFGETGTSQWQWYLADGSGPFTGSSAPIGQSIRTCNLHGSGGTQFRVSWDVETP